MCVDGEGRWVLANFCWTLSPFFRSLSKLTLLKPQPTFRRTEYFRILTAKNYDDDDGDDDDDDDDELFSNLSGTLFR